jgi:Uma2 family endonuclease
VATTTPPAPPRDLAAAARILAASSDGGELFLPEGLDASALERLLRALDGWRCDVVGDRLIWMAPANPWSSRLAARLLVHLARAIDDRRLELDYFGSDAGFVLDPHPEPYGRIVSPDASLVRRARMTPRATPASGFWPLVPDLAIEVRSPGDRQAAWRAKLTAYAGVAGGRLWAIDPQPRSRSVEVWRDGQPLQTLTEPDDELELEDLVPGWRMPLRELWALTDA